MPNPDLAPGEVRRFYYYAVSQCIAIVDPGKGYLVKGAGGAGPPQADTFHSIYDGDGTLVKNEINGVVIYYAGRHYHKRVNGETESVQKFYTAGSSQIAVEDTGSVRTISGGQDSLTWVLSDHLGSTSVTANVDGTSKSEIKYTAFGEVRSSSGTTDTPYQYTGQLSQMEEIGLYYFVARWMDPVTAHFSQADTLVPEPGKSLAYNRYGYVSYNPITFNDPSGHCYNRDSNGNLTERCQNYWAQYTNAIKAKLAPTYSFMQVDLSTFNSRNQYDYQAAFGFNACGLVAGSTSQVTVYDIGKAATTIPDDEDIYLPESGIQPDPLTESYREAYKGQREVTAYNNWSVYGIADELKKGSIVVVDIRVNATSFLPSGENPSFAHFARVLGVDLTEDKIYIENTIPSGPSYWAVPIDEFLTAWTRPETLADHKDLRAQAVSYWGVVIH